MRGCGRGSPGKGGPGGLIGNRLPRSLRSGRVKLCSRGALAAPKPQPSAPGQNQMLTGWFPRADATKRKKNNPEVVIKYGGFVPPDVP